MTSQAMFGKLLREARERKNLDLLTAARRLRIRPDILQSIEDADFSRMPPRGYARNMVNAYARLVNLNPTEITRMYLDEAYAYQVGRARSQAQPTGFNMGNAATRSRSAQRARGFDRFDASEPRQNAFGRTQYDDRRDPFAHGQLNRYRDRDQNHTHPSRHTALPNTNYTNFYAGPSRARSLNSKLPFLVAAAVVLVVLIIVLVFVFGNKGSNTKDDVPSVPITGLTDTSNQGTTGNENTTPQQSARVLVAPEKSVLTYTIPAGESAYIEIYENDTITFGETVSGPTEKSYDVTGTLRLVTTNPSAVSLMVDGEAASLTEVGEGSGVYDCKVDFPAILEQWRAENVSQSTSAAPASTSAAS